MIFMKTNLENYSLKELNNYTFDNLLDKKFYQYWKKYQDELALEIIFSPVCNQGCSYCYLNKDNQGIYSNQNFNVEESLKNVVKILQWLEVKQMMPVQIDIFSGEFFAQKAGYDLLETIINFYE